MTLARDLPQPTAREHKRDEDETDKQQRILHEVCKEQGGNGVEHQENGAVWVTLGQRGESEDRMEHGYAKRDDSDNNSVLIRKITQDIVIAAWGRLVKLESSDPFGSGKAVDARALASLLSGMPRTPLAPTPLLLSSPHEIGEGKYGDFRKKHAGVRNKRASGEKKKIGEGNKQGVGRKEHAGEVGQRRTKADEETFEDREIASMANPVSSAAAAAAAAATEAAVKDSGKHGKEDGSWACATCTLVNVAAVRICEVCGKSKPDDAPSLQKMMGFEQFPAVTKQQEVNREVTKTSGVIQEWMCSTCTFLNDGDAKECVMCLTPLVEKPPQKVDARKDGGNKANNKQPFDAGMGEVSYTLRMRGPSMCVGGRLDVGLIGGHFAGVNMDVGVNVFVSVDVDQNERKNIWPNRTLFRLIPKSHSGRHNRSSRRSRGFKFGC